MRTEEEEDDAEAKYKIVMSKLVVPMLARLDNMQLCRLGLALGRAKESEQASREFINSICDNDLRCILLAAQATFMTECQVRDRAGKW